MRRYHVFAQRLLVLKNILPVRCTHWRNMFQHVKRNFLSCAAMWHIYISHALVKGQNYWALIGWERGKYCCNQERVWKLCDFLNVDNNRYGPKENFAKICKIKWNWIRSVKFEIVRKDFSMTLSVCCHLKLLLPWQRDVTTSLLHWSVSGYTYH